VFLQRSVSVRACLGARVQNISKSYERFSIIFFFREECLHALGRNRLAFREDADSFVDQDQDPDPVIFKDCLFTIAISIDNKEQTVKNPRRRFALYRVLSIVIIIFGPP